MKDKVSPLDSDFKSDSGLDKITIKQILFVLVVAVAVGYGLSFSMADKTINYQVYNWNMEKINRIILKMGANQTIEKLYYLKNNSPVDAITKIVCNTKHITIISNIEKTLLREGEITYIYLNVTNLWDRYMEIEIYIEGEYER